MAGYVEILRVPGVARTLSAQLVARLPSGMLSLAVLLHIERTHGSYGAAGLVLAATSIGQAIAGPLTSRWMGAWGIRRVLTLTMIICALAILTLALVILPVPLTMIVGFIAGLSMPPIQSAVRTIYPKLVNSKQLTPLFSLDASAQEIIWVAGPVVATFVAIQISTTVAILLCAVLLVLGGIWFIASPEVGRVRIPRSRRSLGAVLRNRVVVVATIVGFLLIGACAAIEAGVVAVFGHDGPQAGFVLAIWSIGSLLGGLALGKVSISRASLARRMIVVLVGAGATIIMVDEFWWLSLTLLVSGIGIAPVFAAIFSSVSSSVKFSDTAEAFGWLGTGQLIGAALGSAVAGFLIDGFGAIGAFTAAIGFAALGVIVATTLRNWMPDLRDREVGPIPDTEPVSTILA